MEKRLSVAPRGSAADKPMRDFSLLVHRNQFTGLLIGEPAADQRENIFLAHAGIL